MQLLTRRVVLPLALLIVLRGAADTPSADGSALPADLEAELRELQSSTWSKLITVRASSGYRDNILLSAFRPVSRSFGRAELEAFAFRSVPSTWDWRIFVSGDVLRYVSPPAETGGEQQWFVRGEIGWKGVSWLRGSLAGQGYYQDMVLDLSDTQAERIVAPLRVRGAMLTGAAEFHLPGKITLESSVQLHRSDYRNFAGDYRELKEGLRCGWQPSEHLALSLAGYAHQRRFSQRTEYTAGGRALGGTHLHFAQQEAEAKAKSVWHCAGTWTIDVSAGELRNRDRASGYFDFDTRRGKADVEWKHGAWTIDVAEEREHQAYLVQRVGIGIHPPPRVARNTSTSLRAERELSSAWTAFAEARRERSDSNEAEFSYTSSTVLAGVERTF